MMTDFAQARQQVMQAILQACDAVGRSAATVQLLAVSKTQPAAALRALFAAGQRQFGENYVQEALAKRTELADLPIEWHLIGHLQRNKTREVAEAFDWVHSVDRLLVAERLSAQRPEGRPDLNVCLQVNIDGEDSKSGCPPEQVAGLVAAISALPRLRLRGLMVIPARDHQDAFVRTRALFESVRTSHRQPQDWDTLSMGMSADFAGAIAAGSTCVRIGTALFGARA
jgi:hypothetical protein